MRVFYIGPEYYKQLTSQMGLSPVEQSVLSDLLNLQYHRPGVHYSLFSAFAVPAWVTEPDGIFEVEDIPLYQNGGIPKNARIEVVDGGLEICMNNHVFYFRKNERLSHVTVRQ